MRAYSLDLREKVISHYKKFGNKSETAIIFGIHQDTLNNWLEKLREGSLAAFKTGPKGFKKVDPDEVKAAIKENPDMTLEELGAMFKVSHVAIWKILRKQGWFCRICERKMIFSHIFVTYRSFLRSMPH